jgi:hypothetical protein
MNELKKSTEELNISLNKTKNEVELLSKSLDLKRIEFIEATTKQLEALDNKIKSIEKETVLLHSLPKKLSAQINEIVPDIATEINKLNQSILGNQNKEFNESAVRFKQLQEAYYKKQSVSLDDATLRLSQLKEKIEKIDSQRIKRYFLGLSVVMLISVSASLGATYKMIKMFPQRVQIESPNNVIVQESEVGLWSSKNVNVSGDVKKQR